MQRILCQWDLSHILQLYQGFPFQRKEGGEVAAHREAVAGVAGVSPSHSSLPELLLTSHFLCLSTVVYCSPVHNAIVLYVYSKRNFKWQSRYINENKHKFLKATEQQNNAKSIIVRFKGITV